MAQAEERALQKVEESTDWRAGAWLLERRFRARWARNAEPPQAEGPVEKGALHQHQHLHINFDTIETPVLEFIHRYRLEFGEDPDWDIFKSQFNREPSKEEQKLLTEPKPTPLDPTSIE